MYHEEEQIHGGGIEAKEKETSLWAMERDRTEDSEAVKNRLIWMTYLESGFCVGSGYYQVSCLGPRSYHSRGLC